MPSENINIYSVIDIGTNTCLLLIASLNNNRLNKIFEAQEIPRLGKDLYRTGKIGGEEFEKALKIIKGYKIISEKYDVKKIFAFGTSALRDAKNSRQFMDYIKLATGIKIKVISGEEEAKYSYAGAVFDLDKRSEYAVLDIGGGSTEIFFEDRGNIISRSIDIGSVRIYEEFYKGDFNKINIQNAEKFIFENLKKIDFMIGKRKLAGVAGTLTTLSALKNGLKDFNEEVIHKDILSITEIKNIFDKLIFMNEKQRLAIGSFMKGRSDIIICGAQILINVMGYLQTQQILVSTKGLRYGLLLNLVDFKKSEH